MKQWHRDAYGEYSMCSLIRFQIRVVYSEALRQQDKGVYGVIHTHARIIGNWNASTKRGTYSLHE